MAKSSTFGKSQLLDFWKTSQRAMPEAARWASEAAVGDEVTVHRSFGGFVMAAFVNDKQKP